MLLEGSEGVVVSGVGVNVFQTEEELPTDTPVPVGSLATLTGRPPDRAELLASLLEILEHRYDAWCRSGLTPLLDELEARNVLRGLAVRVGAASGTAGVIAPDGRLTVRRGDGSTVLVGSGEVEPSLATNDTT